MTSYNDTHIGDRVIILGTVTDVSECGVQTIVPDMDSEGFVIAKKVPEPHNLTRTSSDTEKLILGGWDACLKELTGEG